MSTDDQKADLQIDALKAAGCETIFTDQGVSGARRKRPALAEALSELVEGDTLIVWKLDRLGRSLAHLIDLIKDLGNRQVEFRSLQEAVDTKSAGGTLFFHLLGAFAEFERTLISERTRAGQAAARKRGRFPGRPKVLTPEKLVAAGKDLGAGDDLESVAKRCGVRPRTLRRALARG
ncbi:DNA invertase Pin-like site-specific DNA recombinase [Microvirga flocculans]|uniref:DNA invertase Pin-like site-specific DNA recombinase n=1 Tax=Microvirga flocculans TaxID=217168 RepID=A0A7W6IHV3_9HYPH|nr:DNA invertase Pin-like site-specific DNA recombinase [Microvirga flocculans]